MFMFFGTPSKEKIEKTILHSLYKKSYKNVPSEIKTELFTKSEELKKEFRGISNYKKIVVDEKRGLMGLILTGKEPNIIFEMTDFNDINLTLENPRNNNNTITARVVLDLFSEKWSINTRITIEPNAKCITQKSKNSKQIDFQEPGELTLFRSVLQQSVNNAIQKQREYNERQFTFNKDVLIVEAETAFYLPDKYTKNMIINRYSIIKQAFSQPETLDRNILLKIENYKNTLLSKNNTSIIE